MKKLFSLITLLFCSLLSFSQNWADIFVDPLSLPKSDKYTVERIDCRNDKGEMIYGVAFIPAEAKTKKVPLVILSHGFNSTHLAQTHYGQRMAENGIGMYIYDFCGGSVMSKSEGRMQEMSVKTERNDLLNVVRTAKTWSWVDTSNIFLSGESQGGFVTALAGVELQAEIRAMVLLYPALHIPVEMAKTFPDVALKMHADGYEAAALSQELKTTEDGTLANLDAFAGNFTAGPVYPLDAISLNTVDICRSFHKPVFIIHGDKDNMVPITFAFQGIKDFPNASLKILPGAGHGFWAELGTQASLWMLDFVKGQVK